MSKRADQGRPLLTIIHKLERWGKRYEGELREAKNFELMLQAKERLERILRDIERKP